MNVYGKICLEDSLKKEWDPARKVSHILEYIVSLLRKPQLDQPWRPQIAKLYKLNRMRHDKIAADWTEKYA